MNVTVVGSGYVGLVTGACLSEIGNNVRCVDIDAEKVASLSNGEIPIYEPGLEGLFKKNLESGRLSFSTDLGEALKGCELVFIAVGTPEAENGDADLSAVFAVAQEIADKAEEPLVVVNKSTVPVGTGRKVLEALNANPRGLSHTVVSNPEFLREGTAVRDFMEPDRVVIGADSDSARKAMEQLYKPLKARILFTSVESAELIKYASNAFLATKISFINSVSRLCEASDADIEEVAEGMGLDKRIGRAFLDAGLGYGGSCFPKDVIAFVRIAGQKGIDFSLLREVEKINAGQRQLFVEKVEKALNRLQGKKVAVLGLAFKPETDDMRESPALTVIAELKKKGVGIRAYDPKAMENAKKLIDGIEFSDSPYAAAQGADALLLVTDWQEFREMDLDKLKQAMHNPLIVDGRNMFDRKAVEEKGFSYHAIGR